MYVQVVYVWRYFFFFLQIEKIPCSPAGRQEPPSAVSNIIYNIFIGMYITREYMYYTRLSHERLVYETCPDELLRR